MSEITPAMAYKELEPAVMEIVRLIHQCPIGDAGKTGLAMMVATAFFTTLCVRELERQKRPVIINPEIMQDMAGLMVAALTRDKPDLRLVHDAGLPPHVKGESE